MVPPHSAEAAAVVPVTASSLQDRRTQRFELGSIPCGTEELRLHTHLVRERHPCHAEATTQVVIPLSPGDDEFYAAVRGARRILGLTALKLDLGFTRQAELRTKF